MDQRAQKELLALLQDAVKVGGAAIEMRARRFASLVRLTNPDLAAAISPLVSGDALRAGGGAGVRVAAPPVDADTKLPLVRVDLPGQQRQRPVFAPDVHAALERLLIERREADKLAAAELAPIRSLLMSGPPGVGKTMTAAWLADELHLPLYTLDLASVMSSYLGRTGANVRAVLTHAQQEPCVLLLDEFDAIAKRRDDEADVGELKRLVTVILQTIDEWTPQSLLVAATNHGELLDPAVWRRFDLAVTFPLPTLEQRLAALRNRNVPAALAVVVAHLSEGQNMSALTRAIESARKQEVLGTQTFDGALLASATQMAAQLASSDRALRAARRDASIFELHLQNKTAREIADVVGSSHMTVLRTINRLKETEHGGS